MKKTLNICLLASFLILAPLSLYGMNNYQFEDGFSVVEWNQPVWSIGKDYFYFSYHNATIKEAPGKHSQNLSILDVIPNRVAKMVGKVENNQNNFSVALNYHLPKIINGKITALKFKNILKNNFLLVSHQEKIGQGDLIVLFNKNKMPEHAAIILNREAVLEKPSHAFSPLRIASLKQFLKEASQKEGSLQIFRYQKGKFPRESIAKVF